MRNRPIILISPPSVESVGNKGSLGGSEHLGLGYIASNLELHDFKVSILNYEEIYTSPEKAVAEILKLSPLLIGISPTSYSIKWAFEFSKRVKSLSHIMIVLGGHLATHLSEILLQECPYIDVVVIGDGESTLLNLAECVIQKKTEIGAIKNICYRSGESGIILTKRIFNDENLDNYPWPKRSTSVLTKTSARIIMSRGCNFNCDFCTTPNFYNRQMRNRSVEDVVSEMENLHKKQGFNRFFFSDDLFFSDSQESKLRITEFIYLLNKRLRGIEFRCDLRADVVMKNLDLVKELYLVGMKYVFIGIESYLENDLEHFNKNISSNTMMQLTSKLHDIGISVVPGFIMFNQNTTLDGLVKNARKLFEDSFLYRTTTFARTCMGYPGSKIYKEMIETKSYDAERSNLHALYPKFESKNVMIMSIVMQNVELLFKDMDSRMLNNVIYKYDNYSLRSNNDSYREIIFDAHIVLQDIQKVYLNTFCEAIDMTIKIPLPMVSEIISIFEDKYNQINSLVGNFEKILNF
jgi:radical SAM superfamily enzyme YgiQ (UPF0313 family)